MAQYVLHYAPDNASLIIRLVLEELGLSYDSRPVDRSTRAQDSAAFKALNPLRRMPALGPTPFSNPQPPNPPEGSAV